MVAFLCKDNYKLHQIVLASRKTCKNKWELYERHLKKEFFTFFSIHIIFFCCWNSDYKKLVLMWLYLPIVTWRLVSLFSLSACFPVVGHSGDKRPSMPAFWVTSRWLTSAPPGLLTFPHLLQFIKTLRHWFCFHSKQLLVVLSMVSIVYKTKIGKFNLMNHLFLICELVFYE